MRLIDEIQSLILLEGRSDLQISLSFEGLAELLKDFNEEFETEYMELGRDADVIDLKEYLNVPILVDSNAGEKYRILTSAL